MIVQSLGLFLTAVTPTAVTLIVVILPEFTWIDCNLLEFTWLYLTLPTLYLNLPEFNYDDCNLLEFTWKFTWIYLNLPKFTCIYLNLPKCTWFYLNIPEFTLICLNLPEFTWVYLNFSLIYLNFHEFTLICLKLLESTWILKKDKFGGESFKNWTLQSSWSLFFPKSDHILTWWPSKLTDCYILPYTSFLRYAAL